TIKAYSGSGKAGPKNKIIKDGSVRINRKLNQTIKDRGDQFKLTRNTRVSSSDSLKSVVELINSQLSTEEGRDSSIYDEKHLEEVRSSKQCHTCITRHDGVGSCNGGIPVADNSWSLVVERELEDSEEDYSVEALILNESKRVSRGKADKIIASLGFQCSHRVEAIGFFGGIWVG
ncbi:hypothetical protein Gotur_007147, partial [Gossypium turneri]